MKDGLVNLFEQFRILSFETLNPKQDQQFLKLINYSLISLRAP